mgnify:FL=1
MKTLTKLIALVGLAVGAKIGWDNGGKDMAQNAAYDFAEDKFKGRAQQQIKNLRKELAKKDQHIAELGKQLKQLSQENEQLQAYKAEAEKKKDSLQRMFGEDEQK